MTRSEKLAAKEKVSCPNVPSKSKLWVTVVESDLVPVNVTFVGPRRLVAYSLRSIVLSEYVPPPIFDN